MVKFRSMQESIQNNGYATHSWKRKEKLNIWRCYAIYSRKKTSKNVESTF
uniref:Uncharacterized protein n=1 Tax=Arundo donax TaxID=35708 RepID=A0A0A9EE90_ARUDO